MDGLLDTLAEFLLKHPREELARGELVFSPVVPLLLVILVALGGAALTGWAVARLRGTAARDRWILGLVRAAVFVLVGACLARPTLVLSRAVPQRNVLAVVYDDSRSMAVTDMDGASRTAAVRAALGDSSDVMRALTGRFAVRRFRAGAGALPITGSGTLQSEATRTDLAAALGDVEEMLADMPLAGVVVVSDGAHNGGGDLEAVLGRLAARGVPVHTVGVGTPRFERDIGVDALRLPATALAGGEARGEAVLRLRGVAGERAVVRVEAAGRLVGVDTLVLPADRDLLPVPIRVPAVGEGEVPVRVAVLPLAGEVTTVNNHASAVLRVRAGPEKVLYVEGEPRPELPFLRRAIAPDSTLQLVTLIRTAREKHLRLGVDDSLELANGFPATREELFGYRAVILGSVEAAYFTGEQLRLLRDFVAERGGGLLVLGGPRSLTEGGYAGTPLDDALPLVLGGNGGPVPMATLAVRPTREGTEHPVLQLPDSVTSAWELLPSLTSVNAPGTPRAGAVTLLEGVTPSGAVQPVLATQRFGSGRASVLAVQDLWRWQMWGDAPDGDRTHAELARRLVRWLVDDVPDRIELEVSPGLTAPGEPAAVRVRVRDSTFAPRDDAAVTVRVVPPDAPAYRVPLLPALGDPGEHEGTVTPSGPGRYRLEVEVVAGADTSVVGGLLLSDVDRGDPGRTERDDALLARIADRTGGRAHDLTEVDRLPAAVELTESGITARASTDLWDAPIVFLLLVLLLGIDWAWRRRAGLA